MKAENYQQETRQIHGVDVVITTYRIGDRFFCQLSNKNPGSQISRSEGRSYQEALETAWQEASDKLKPRH